MPNTKPQNYPSGRLLRSKSLLNLMEEQDQPFSSYQSSVHVPFNFVSVEDIATQDNKDTEETPEIGETYDSIENVNPEIKNSDINSRDEMASGLHMQKFNGKESPSLWWSQLKS